MEPITHVSLTLDQRGLQTVKMGLTALVLNAQALDVEIDRQVAQALAEATGERPPAAAVRANGHDTVPG